MKQNQRPKIAQTVADTILSRQLADFDTPILVGISGGVDSLSLLDILHRIGFTSLHSIHVSIERSIPLPFADFCRARSEFTVIETDILDQVKQSSRKNKCYMCSRAKRKVICSYAVEHGFGSLALAHHRDDALETFLLNVMFQREISTMLPSQELFKGKLQIIRPLYDVTKKDIIKYARLEKLPVSDWRCGLENLSRRGWIREQLKLWQKANPGIKIADNIFRSMQNVNTAWLPQAKKEKIPGSF